jgi:hypothetical protein
MDDGATFCVAGLCPKRPGSSLSLEAVTSVCLPLQRGLQPDGPFGASRCDSATTSTITLRGHATSDPDLKKGVQQ